ncbi:MAG: S-layer homology domain-containing protein [Oscillospiraceae bacterium]|jgi:hypothetical protein|nr:S-layer homology domain-containing protein [Oscillospiraceae bacterium]
MKNRTTDALPDAARRGSRVKSLRKRSARVRAAASFVALTLALTLVPMALAAPPIELTTTDDIVTAIAGATDGDVFVLADGEYLISKVIYITGPLNDITIKAADGANVTIKPSTALGSEFDVINTNGGYRWLLTADNIDGFTLAGITFDADNYIIPSGGQKLGCVNIVNGTTATLKDTAVQNSGRAGMVVSASDVTVDGFTASDNAWGDINLDPKGDDASLIIAGNGVTLGSATGIYVDDAAHNADVTVTNDTDSPLIMYVDPVTLTVMYLYDEVIPGSAFTFSKTPETAAAYDAAAKKLTLAPVLTADSSVTVSGLTLTAAVTLGGTEIARHDWDAEFNGSDTADALASWEFSGFTRNGTYTVTYTLAGGVMAADTFTFAISSFYSGGSPGIPDTTPRPTPTPTPTPSPTPEATPTPADPAAGSSDWAHDEVAAAIEAGLVSENLQGGYTSPVTRGEVAQMFINLLEQSTGKTIARILAEHGLTVNAAVFTDTRDEAVVAANALGILRGVGGGRFDPDAPLTRAQIAAVINRTAAAIGYATTGYAHAFTDVAEHWVDAELGFPVFAGIIQGVGNNRFAPDDELTTEEAILIVYRAYAYFTP